MPSIMESALQFIWFWPISHVNPILRRSHLLPSQLPGEYTAVLPHIVHSTLSHFPSHPVYLTLEELETLWFGVSLMVCRWPLMCTNHIDMTAHTPAFLSSWVRLVYIYIYIYIYMCVCVCVSAAQMGIVTYHTLWNNAYRMVTHPCINWAYDSLISMIKHKTFSPCYYDN